MITLFESIQILIWNFLSSLLLRVISNNISLLFNKLIKTKCSDESANKTIMQKVPVQIKISIYKVIINERKKICHVIFNDNFHNCVRLKLPTGNYEITTEYTDSNESM